MPDIAEPVANIRAALKGKVGKTLVTVRTPDGEKVVPSYPLAAVVAGDVLAVAKTLKEPPENAPADRDPITGQFTTRVPPIGEHTELTVAVYLGAANNKPDATVYQEVRALKELLAQAGEDAAS